VTACVLVAEEVGQLLQLVRDHIGFIAQDLGREGGREEGRDGSVKHKDNDMERVQPARGGREEGVRCC